MRDDRKRIGTHWDGCEEVHPYCKIAKLERTIRMQDEEIERLQEELASAIDQSASISEE